MNDTTDLRALDPSSNPPTFARETAAEALTQMRDENLPTSTQIQLSDSRAPSSPQQAAKVPQDQQCQDKPHKDVSAEHTGMSKPIQNAASEADKPDINASQPNENAVPNADQFGCGTSRPNENATGFVNTTPAAHASPQPANPTSAIPDSEISDTALAIAFDTIFERDHSLLGNHDRFMRMLGWRREAVVALAAKLQKDQDEFVKATLARVKRLSSMEKSQWMGSPDFVKSVRHSPTRAEIERWERKVMESVREHAQPAQQQGTKDRVARLGGGLDIDRLSSRMSDAYVTPKLAHAQLGENNQDSPPYLRVRPQTHSEDANFINPMADYPLGFQERRADGGSTLYSTGDGNGGMSRNNMVVNTFYQSPSMGGIPNMGGISNMGCKSSLFRTLNPTNISLATNNLGSYYNHFRSTRVCACCNIAKDEGGAEFSFIDNGRACKDCREGRHVLSCVPSPNNLNFPTSPNNYPNLSQQGEWERGMGMGMAMVQEQYGHGTGDNYQPGFGQGPVNYNQAPHTFDQPLNANPAANPAQPFRALDPSRPGEKCCSLCHHFQALDRYAVKGKPSASTCRGCRTAGDKVNRIKARQARDTALDSGLVGKCSTCKKGRKKDKFGPDAGGKKKDGVKFKWAQTCKPCRAAPRKRKRDDDEDDGGGDGGEGRHSSCHGGYQGQDGFNGGHSQGDQGQDDQGQDQGQAKRSRHGYGGLGLGAFYPQGC